MRLLELLAAQAAVAFENARLLEAERRSVAISKALLEIATIAAADPSVSTVASHVARAARELTGSAAAAIVTRDPGEDGRHRVLACHGDEAVRSVALAAMHAGHPFSDEVEVIGLADLPVLSLSASDSASVAALAPVNGALLVVLCGSVSDRAVGTIAAIAGRARWRFAVPSCSRCARRRLSRSEPSRQPAPQRALCRRAGNDLELTRSSCATRRSRPRRRTTCHADSAELVAGMRR